LHFWTVSALSTQRLAVCGGPTCSAAIAIEGLLLARVTVSQEHVRWASGPALFVQA
jgi:hypothetical protein